MSSSPWLNMVNVLKQKPYAHGVLTDEAYRAVLEYKKRLQTMIGVPGGEGLLFIQQRIDRCKAFVSGRMPLTAFLEAIGANQCAPGVDYHVDNCKCWLS